LPSEKIIYKANKKYFLPEAMKGIMPEKIRTRQSKIGFGTPEDEWFRTTLFQSFIENMLNSRDFNENPYINSKIAKEQYSLHLSRKTNISQEIWKWINLNEWLNKIK